MEYSNNRIFEHIMNQLTLNKLIFELFMLFDPQL